MNRVSGCFHSCRGCCKVLAGGTEDHGEICTSRGTPVSMRFPSSRVAQQFGSGTVPQILILQILQNFPKSNLCVSHRITIQINL